ncbi:MAG: VCBS repeat-containing protein [Pirellulales bacterium]
MKSFLLSATLATACLISNVVCGVICVQAQDLRPLEYRGDKAVPKSPTKVDLGVGLWAWPLPCDADGDGDYDLIVSCPDKPSNGIWFFENTTGDTAKNPKPIFQPAKKLSKTVHYVMPSYVKVIDTAGSEKIEMRVLSPGYEYADFTKSGLDKRTKLSVEANFYKPAWNQPKGPKVRHNQWRYVDYEGDGDLDLVVAVEDWSEYGWDDAWSAEGKWTHGPLHGFVLLLRNEGDDASPKYAEPAKVKAGGQAIDVFGCASPSFADFDGDGDFDLICGEFLDGFTYFQNVGSRTQPEYAVGKRLRADDGSPLHMDLEMIVPIAFDWDRDGDPDLIVGDEDGRVAFVECVRPGPEGPVFRRPSYFEQVPDQLKCGALATPFGVDWDDDGDTDIVSGNTSGEILFFENLSGAGVERPSWNAPAKIAAGGKPFRVMAGPNGSIQGPAEAKWGYTTLNVADWDGDGRKDIVFNSIWGRVQWLRNLGTDGADDRSKQPKLSEPMDIEVQWPEAPPKPSWTWWQPTAKQLVTQWRTTPVVYDFDHDGLMDLAMLDVEGYPALYRRAKQEGRLVLMPPKRVFCDDSGKPLRFNDKQAGGSGRRKWAVVDWNRDGHLDLLLNSANADLYLGLGEQDGVFRFKRSGSLAERNIEGHDVSPAIVDFNSDSVPDFLGGAEDGRFYYMRNTTKL